MSINTPMKTNAIKRCMLGILIIVTVFTALPIYAKTKPTKGIDEREYDESR